MYVYKQAAVVQLRRRPLDLEIKSPHLHMRLLASVKVEIKLGDRSDGGVTVSVDKQSPLLKASVHSAILV